MKKENIVEKLTNDMRNGAISFVAETILSMDDIELCDRDGRTLLINAACYDCFDIVELLLKQGADVNTKDKIGNTALHAAVISGNVSIVRLLLENGADVNQKNMYGNTPLWVATPTQPKELFSTLLSFGADPNIKNDYDMSPMDCMRAYPDIIELFTKSSNQSGDGSVLV